MIFLIVPLAFNLLNVLSRRKGCSGVYPLPLILYILMVIFPWSIKITDYKFFDLLLFFLLHNLIEIPSIYFYARQGREEREGSRILSNKSNQ